jgi:integrase
VLRITAATYEKDAAMVHRAKTKNGRPHSIPLPRQAVEVLDSLPANRQCWFFPHRDDPTRPANHQSMRKLVSIFLADNPSFAHFTPKDMRRTFKTLAGAAGIPKEMRDRLQNHAEAGVSARHYDKYDYLPERRAAMDKWADYLDGVISGEIGKVVELLPAAA